MAIATDERIRVLDRLHKRLRETMPERLTPELLKVLEEESTVLADLLDEWMGVVKPPSTTAAAYEAWARQLWAAEPAPEPVSPITGLTDGEYFQRNLQAIRKRPYAPTEPADTREEADLPWGQQ